MTATKKTSQGRSNGPRGDMARDRLHLKRIRKYHDKA
jgi:hypothetical protein